MRLHLWPVLYFILFGPFCCFSVGLVELGFFIPIPWGVSRGLVLTNGFWCNDVLAGTTRLLTALPCASGGFGAKGLCCGCSWGQAVKGHLL